MGRTRACLFLRNNQGPSRCERSSELVLCASLGLGEPLPRSRSQAPVCWEQWLWPDLTSGAYCECLMNECSGSQPSQSHLGINSVTVFDTSFPILKFTENISHLLKKFFRTSPSCHKGSLPGKPSVIDRHVCSSGCQHSGLSSWEAVMKELVVHTCAESGVEPDSCKCTPVSGHYLLTYESWATVLVATGFFEMVTFHINA